jgi:HlyD family secretion protein
MYAVAEVFETDIARVHVSQKAVISADFLSQPVTGLVERIASDVSKLTALPDDALQFVDGRVFNVRIRVADPGRVAGRINAKVAIRIEP